MRLKILYLIVALFPIVTTAASIPTKNGTETVETSKNESMPIAKPKPNDTNSKNVSTQVSNPLEAKNDTVNATDKGASLKNVETKIRGIRGIKDNELYENSICCRTAGCKNYQGHRSRTKSGKICQRWGSKNTRTFRLSSIKDENYCRNPDNSDTVWCYTMDKDKMVWEYCDVPKCSEVGR